MEQRAAAIDSRLLDVPFQLFLQQSTSEPTSLRSRQASDQGTVD
jgi:hypothetical protein